MDIYQPPLFLISAYVTFSLNRLKQKLSSMFRLPQFVNYGSTKPQTSQQARHSRTCLVPSDRFTRSPQSAIRKVITYMKFLWNAPPSSSLSALGWKSCRIVPFLIPSRHPFRKISLCWKRNPLQTILPCFPPTRTEPITNNWITIFTFSGKWNLLNGQTLSRCQGSSLFWKL